MDRSDIERIISTERLDPYLNYHSGDFIKAVAHYKFNIEISAAFYPLLSILEVGLRNNIDYQLKRRFDNANWFDSSEFVKIVGKFQIDRVSEARSSILSEKKEITAGKIISELSFGFWTSLLDSRFERTLWKHLRHSFPNCPKKIRQRKTMSTKFNGIRKLRNRIFHHESISWDISALTTYKREIIEGINWLDKGLMNWSEDLFFIDEVIQQKRYLICRD